MDDIHAVQIETWYESRLTRQSLEYLSQWTYDLRDPVKLVAEEAKEFKYNPNCLTAAGRDEFYKRSEEEF
jgi:hypothetical protein